MRTRLVLSCVLLLIAATIAVCWYVNAAWREVAALCAAVPQGNADAVEPAFADSPSFQALSEVYLALSEDALQICETKSLNQITDSDRAALAEAESSLEAPLADVLLALQADGNAPVTHKHAYSVSGSLRLTYFLACARGEAAAAEGALQEYVAYLRRVALRDDLDGILVIDLMTDKLLQLLDRVKPFQPGHAAGMTAMLDWDQGYDLQGHLQRSLRAAESDIRQDFCRYLADISTPVNVRWLAVKPSRWQDYWPLRVVDMRNTLRAMASDVQRSWCCGDYASTNHVATDRIWSGPLCESWNWTAQKMQEVVCRHAARRTALTEYGGATG